MTDWLELLRDIVKAITSFLSLADKIHFSAVCQNWCSVIKENRHHPVPQLPWLVLTDDSIGKRRIFDMSENKHYCFDIPELCEAFIVGSSFGWLFAVRPNVDAYLVNPSSGAKFSLPSLPLYSNHSYLDRRQHLLDHIERDEMGWPLRHRLQNTHHFLVRKAVLSSDPSRCTDFVVFIVLAGQYHLAFYKPGDTTWTIFDGEKFVQRAVLCSS